jgi:hypothetical protein
MVFIYIDQYECECGECPVLKTLNKKFNFDSSKNNSQEKKVFRMLLAYGNYNEADPYDLDLLEMYASKCLQLSKHDEEAAFNMLVQAMDDGSGLYLLEIELEDEEEAEEQQVNELQQPEIVQEFIQFQAQENPEVPQEEEFEPEHPSNPLIIMEDYYGMDTGKQMLMVAQEGKPKNKLKPLKRFFKNFFSRITKQRKSKSKSIKKTSVIQNIVDNLEPWTSPTSSDEETDISSVSSLELEQELVYPNINGTVEEPEVEQEQPPQVDKRIGSQPEQVRVYVDQYLCYCGECPHTQAIKDQVELHSDSIDGIKSNQVVRLLNAYATYNEAQEFKAELLFGHALRSLMDCHDNEDLAFTALIQIIASEQSLAPYVDKIQTADIVVDEMIAAVGTEENQQRSASLEVLTRPMEDIINFNQAKNQTKNQKISQTKRIKSFFKKLLRIPSTSKSFLKKLLRIPSTSKRSQSKSESSQHQYQPAPAPAPQVPSASVKNTSASTSTSKTIMAEAKEKTGISLHEKYAPWSFNKLKEERKKYIVAPEAYMWI